MYDEDDIDRLTREANTIVQITHDLNVAAAASRILHLKDGVLTA